MEWQNINRELVLEFFYFFSRFEYALKRAGFLTTKKWAEPNWTGFFQKVTAAEILADPSDVELKKSLHFLEKRKPRYQANENGKMVWLHICKKEDWTRERYVLELIKTVRNNLFHGGKFPEGPISEPAGDEELLRHCLVILKRCLACDDKVKQMFDS